MATLGPALILYAVAAATEALLVMLMTWDMRQRPWTTKQILLSAAIWPYTLAKLVIHLTVPRLRRGLIAKIRSVK